MQHVIYSQFQYDTYSYFIQGTKQIFSCNHFQRKYSKRIDCLQNPKHTTDNTSCPICTCVYSWKLQSWVHPDVLGCSTTKYAWTARTQIKQRTILIKHANSANLHKPFQNNYSSLPHLLTIKFPWTTKSCPSPMAELMIFLIVVALDAMLQLRQSGPHNDKHPACNIKYAYNAVLRTANQSKYEVWDSATMCNETHIYALLRSAQKARRTVEIMRPRPAIVHLQAWKCKYINAIVQTIPSVNT